MLSLRYTWQIPISSWHFLSCSSLQFLPRAYHFSDWKWKSRFSPQMLALLSPSSLQAMTEGSWSIIPQCLHPWWKGRSKTVAMPSPPGLQGNWTSVALSINLLISSPPSAFFPFPISLVHTLTVFLPSGITSQISYYTQILISVSALGKPNPRQCKFKELWLSPTFSLVV